MNTQLQSVSITSRLLNLFMVMIIICSLVYPLFVIKTSENIDNRSPHLSYWHNGDDPAVSMRANYVQKLFTSIGVLLTAAVLCAFVCLVVSLCNTVFKPHFFQRRRRLLLLPIKFTSHYVFPSKY